MKHTIEDLRQLQAMDLQSKIMLTKARIREWVEVNGQDNVYVSFSGGKDSTVLLHLVREEYPDVEAVFVNTGLEYPEIQKFAQSFDNVTVLRPKMRFDEVIRKYGYPIIGKEIAYHIHHARNGSTYSTKKMKGNIAKKYARSYTYTKYLPLLNTDFQISDSCCRIMKKAPTKTIKKYGITAQMAEESNLRTQMWLNNGCNGFEMKKPTSNPMSFWTEQDVLTYIHTYKIPICSVYGDIVTSTDGEQLAFEECGKFCTTGCKRTGCIFCGFGAHLEKGETRFERLKHTHPRQYEYCIGGGAYDTDGLWKPNKNGLGMGHVFDELNKIYGENFIRYK